MFGAKQLVNYTTENGYNIVHGENSIVLLLVFFSIFLVSFRY